LPRFRMSRERGALLEHATLSLDHAAAELAQPNAHVASQNMCAGAGLDDDHLMPIRMPGAGSGRIPGSFARARVR
jgi:sugar (pentulose or hexulose) kinase